MDSARIGSRIGNESSAGPVTVGPRYGVERELRNIWAEVTGQRNIGVHDNFFDVGGTSVTALKVVSRIKAAFGYEIPLAAMLQAPTIAGIAMLMRGSATGEPRALVPIRAGGRRPPLFCFHPLGGSVARFFALARALGDDQPVYGLQALGLFDSALAQDRVEQMAHTYVEEILSVCPHGPYQLIGYSLGGTLAYEAARQLRERTGRTALVVVIDTEPAYPQFDHDELPARAVAEFALEMTLPAQSVRGLGRQAVLRLIYDEAVRRKVITYDFPIDRLASIYDTVSGAMTAVSRYRPGPYPGSLVLIRSDCDDTKPGDLGWGTLVSTVETEFVTLGHFVVMEAKGAARVAQVLRRHLGKAIDDSSNDAH